MNEELRNAYAKLLEGLTGKKYAERDNDTTVFHAIKGKSNVDFMLVGRAPNGWGLYYNRSKKLGETRNTLEWVLDEMNTEKDLAVEISKWESEGKYFTGGSQFWRVGQRIAKSVLNRDDKVFDNVLYSNLYKVASNGKNPSQRMMNATIENCINILKIEIEIFQPKKILFLTGHDWIEPFGKELNFKKTDTSDSNLVSFIGMYGNIEVVVAVHPQGKKEDDIVREIRKAFRLPLP